MSKFAPLDWVDLNKILSPEYKARVKICESCEHRAEWNRCGLCGCFIASKCLLDRASCPDSRW